MARQKAADSEKSINKSEEIRQVFKRNPGMKAKEVVAKLGEKGVSVSCDLVYFVKGQIQGRKGHHQKDANKAPRAAKINGAINKSEEIREVFRANPGMKAKEVASTLLAKKGIEVNEGLIYLVKGQMMGREHRKEKVRKIVAKVSETTGTTEHSDIVTLIIKVKTLAAEVGGIEKLKALVEALS